MTQEVEITLKGEFDARLSKTEIRMLIQNLLTENFGVNLYVDKVKEEAEIYKLNSL